MAETVQPDRTAAESNATSRRRGFGAGLKLAAAGTAALVALPLGTAAADNDDRNDNRGNGNRDDKLRGLERSIQAHEDALQRLRDRLDDRRDQLAGLTGITRASRLFRVNDINTDDFGANLGTRDPLTNGAVRLVLESGNDARVYVVLNGASANVSYQVWFVRFSDKARTDLGWVRTNGSGDFEGFTRTNQDNTGDFKRLGGGNRIGIFIVARDGSNDQFVTGLSTRSG
jgi:hypothetical protein